MNISEAVAVHTLLGWLMPDLAPGVDTDTALDAAATLADRASRALSAGPTGDRVRELWPHLAERLTGDRTDVRACRVCGCTDDDCTDCVEETGQPCTWAEADLCSRCAEQPVETVQPAGDRL